MDQAPPIRACASPRADGVSDARAASCGRRHRRCVNRSTAQDQGDRRDPDRQIPQDDDAATATATSCHVRLCSTCASSLRSLSRSRPWWRWRSRHLAHRRHSRSARPWHSHRHDWWHFYRRSRRRSLCSRGRSRVDVRAHQALQRSHCHAMAHLDRPHIPRCLVHHGPRVQPWHLQVILRRPDRRPVRHLYGL